MCEALANLKVRDEDGTIREIRSGDVFMPANPEAVKMLIGRGLIMDVLDVSHTLDVILIAERDRIIKGKVWKPTAETRDIETRIDSLYKGIIHGHGNLEDFKGLCIRWRESGVSGQYMLLQEGGANSNSEVNALCH